MDAALQWLEAVFRGIPLPVLEVWGRFGALIGLVLMVCAFGGITFKPGGNWGLGRERQSWDAKALLGIVVTFVGVICAGYVGSFIVLVPGAQTFESLKDLVVFVCILIFGYPALIAVPFAYGVADLIEGVPPGFMLDWLPGYFINAAFFWVASQLIGKNPDFTRAKTWGWYALFVLVFMSLEPQLWGYLCSNTFTPELSYRSITPALFLTTSITWLIAPFAMLLALPLARRLGLFWAESPGSVRERLLGSKEWVWVSGQQPGISSTLQRGLPIRAFLVAPFIALILTMVGATASVTLRSAERGANQLAARLHQEIAQNIILRLDLAVLEQEELPTRAELDALLRRLLIAEHGRALISDPSGRVIAATTEDRVSTSAIEGLRAIDDGGGERSYRFDVVTEKPLSRETWLAQATPYAGRAGWMLITAIPESYFLGGVRDGNSQSAMLLALALLLSLGAAVLLSAMVTRPVIRVANATRDLEDDLSRRLPPSRLQELQMLSSAFNDLATRLQSSFGRLQLATRAAKLGIWDLDVASGKVVWDEEMCRQHGITVDQFEGNSEGWYSRLVPEDREASRRAAQSAMKNGHEMSIEFRVPWPDGSIRYHRGLSQTIRGPDGKALRMVGINIDITEAKQAELELLRHRNHLEALVAERTAELLHRTSQLEVSNRELESFSYSVSHDLRAPLRGIDGWSLALLEDYGSLLDEKATGYLQRVRNETQRMGGLIDDLLKLSQVSRAGMKLQEVDLSSLAQVVVRRLEEGNPGRATEVIIEPGLTVQGDSHFLEVALSNLLGNAWKFTSKTAGAKIEFGRATKEGVPVFFVRDNGAGFDMTYAQKLFGAFQRMHSQAEFPGNGVGLAMVQRIVNLHHGKIWAETRVDQGATFFFTLGDVPC